MVTADSEVQTPTLEAPAESLSGEAVVGAPLAGDAGGQSAVDAAGATQESEGEAPSSFESFEAYEQSRQEKESGQQPPPEASQEREEQPLVDPRAYAQYRQTYAQAVQRVQQTVGDLEKELVSDYALPEATAKRIAKDMHDRVNELHAHGLNFYGMEAATQAERRAVVQFNTLLQQGLEKGLPKPLQSDFARWLGEAQKESENGVITHDTWIGKVVELARKGYVTEARAKADRADAFNAARGIKEQAGEADGSRSGSNVRGSASNTNNSLAGYESRIAKGEQLTDSQWSAYERLRSEAGLS